METCPAPTWHLLRFTSLGDSPLFFFFSFVQTKEGPDVTTFFPLSPVQIRAYLHSFFVLIRPQRNLKEKGRLHSHTSELIGDSFSNTTNATTSATTEKRVTYESTLAASDTSESNTIVIIVRHTPFPLTTTAQFSIPFCWVPLRLLSNYIHTQLRENTSSPKPSLPI